MSLAMKDQSAAIPHLNKGEIADLRGDVDGAFGALELGDGYPTLSRIRKGSAVLGLSLPFSAPITGTGLLQDQVAAELTLGVGTAALKFIANRPGTPGNDISVEVLAGAAEAITVVGNKISVTLNSGVSTSDDIYSLVDGEPDAMALVNLDLGDVGIMLPAAETHLAGGEGLGLSVKVNGIEQVVEGAVTDTVIPMAIADLTGALDLDTASVLVTSNGIQSNSMTVVVSIPD